MCCVKRRHIFQNQENTILEDHGIRFKQTYISPDIRRLTNDGIIFNKRGIGYFICEGAREKVLEKMREDFMQNELPGILKKIRLLGLSPEVLAGSCSKDTGE